MQDKKDNNIDEEEKLKSVRRRVQKQRVFWSSCITFIWVNLLLLIINLITSPRHLWFYWVTIIWAIVLIGQAINTFSIRDRFIGQDWEERKVRKEMERWKKDKKS